MTNLTEQQKKEFAQKLKGLYQDFNEMNVRQENELKDLKNKANSLPEKMCSFDEEFEKLTSLTPKDDAFLIFATLLQVLRSYLINLKSATIIQYTIKGRFMSR